MPSMPSGLCAVRAISRDSASIWLSSVSPADASRSRLTAPYACVGPAANRSTWRATSASSRSSSHTRSIRFIASASSAVNRRFVSISSRARRIPASLGRKNVELPSGDRPAAV